MANNPFAKTPTNGQTMPAAAAPQEEGEFTFELPPDPSWQPFEKPDVLPMDGFYYGQITNESPRKGEKPGVFLTITLEDEDVKGLKISTFLSDPTAKNTGWLWRNILRSIHGSVEAGQQGISYKKGYFTGHYVFFKTESRLDNQGERATQIKDWITQEEMSSAVAAGNTRWPASISERAQGAPGFGATPTQAPAGFGVANNAQVAAPAQEAAPAAGPPQAQQRTAPPSAGPPQPQKAFTKPSFPGLNKK
jgi:hypothetical protein